MTEEWLVDRKRIPSDWRKRLAAVRAKVSAAFSSLPKDIDPYFQTLDPEGYFYFLLTLSFVSRFSFASCVASLHLQQFVVCFFLWCVSVVVF